MYEIVVVVRQESVVRVQEDITTSLSSLLTTVTYLSPHSVISSCLVSESLYILTEVFTTVIIESRQQYEGVIV